MAVFTPVSDDQARAFLSGYDLGDLVGLTPILEGIENTNYRLDAGAGRFVLTLFEGRTEASALPFCLGLGAHLADHGLPSPRPIADRSGAWLGRLNDRPAALLEWLPGDWPRAPTEGQTFAAGVMLARLHLAGRDYPHRRPNPMGRPAWERLIARCEGATGDRRVLLDRLSAALAALVALGDPIDPDLPSGAIHADYFPDNVLFVDEAVTGVIDLYFACTGPFAYDLAIALNAWGFDGEGAPDPAALAAFRAGYATVRRLTAAEDAALPRLAQAAALRFALTRLHDLIFHDPAALVTPKDPAPYLRRLDFWADQPR